MTAGLSLNPHEAEQRPNGRKATNWKMRACACRCTIWVHHELIYGSKIFSTVLSNIVSCSTSGGRLSSPNFEKFRNERGHSSVTLCPLHRVALHFEFSSVPAGCAASQRDAVQYFSASFRFDLHPARPLAVEQNQHARARAAVSLSFPTLSSWRTCSQHVRRSLLCLPIFRLVPSIRGLHSILLALAARRLLGTGRLLRMCWRGTLQGSGVFHRFRGQLWPCELHWSARVWLRRIFNTQPRRHAVLLGCR